LNVVAAAALHSNTLNLIENKFVFSKVVWDNPNLRIRGLGVALDWWTVIMDER
jgi:hypothetical protein